MNVFDLWLPVLLSGLATHILSTLAWMLLPHHKSEWNALSIEDELIDLLDRRQVRANQYVFPFARDPQVMKSDEFRSKQAKCRGMLVLWEAPPNMGLAIAQTFAFFLVAAFCIGYVASLSLPAGATFGEVFPYVVSIGLLTHCFAKFPHVFWFRRRVMMELLDGVAFALATGLIFALCWPGA